MGYHGQSWASKGLPGHYLGWTTNYAFRPKSYRDVTGSTVSFLSFLHFHDLFLRRFGVFSLADRLGAPEPFWIAASLCHDGGMSHAGPSPGRHIVKRYSLARLYDTSTLAYVDVGPASRAHPDGRRGGRPRCEKRRGHNGHFFCGSPGKRRASDAGLAGWGKCQAACKPGSVRASGLAPSGVGRPFLWDAPCSAPRATNPGDGAEMPLRPSSRMPPAAPIRSCSRWGLPCRPCHQARGALLPPRFTLACRARRLCRRFVFCGTFPGVAPAGR
jgi:hypothetical protein